MYSGALFLRISRDYNILITTVFNLNWDPFFNIGNPDELWEFMENKLIEQVNLMCPSKKYRVKEAREPWITNEAIEAIKEKDRL